MIHWAVKYIGMKYVLGGRGPYEVDCWGLLWLIYAREFNLELPRYPGIALATTMVINSTLYAAVATDWKEIDKPFDGAAVGMSQHTLLHHVGVYTTADGGKFLHAWDRHNVVADTGEGLRMKGFRVVKFFKHRQWPTS